jgi:hypothetical protein
VPLRRPEQLFYFLVGCGLPARLPGSVTIAILLCLLVGTPARGASPSSQVAGHSTILDPFSEKIDLVDGRSVPDRRRRAAGHWAMDSDCRTSCDCALHLGDRRSTSRSSFCCFIGCGRRNSGTRRAWSAFSGCPALWLEENRPRKVIKVMIIGGRSAHRVIPFTPMRGSLTPLQGRNSPGPQWSRTSGAHRFGAL